MPPKRAKGKTARADATEPAAVPKKKAARKEPSDSAAPKKVDPDLPIASDGSVYHLACTPKDLADRIILVGDPGRVDVVGEHLDKKSIVFRGSHREIRIITGTYKKVPVSVLSTGMGTDNVEIVMNEIYALKRYNPVTATWAKEGDASLPPVVLIRVGTCGSPRPDVPVGTLAITRHAIGMDNTCRFYESPKLTASEAELVKKLEKTCLEATSPYVSTAHADVTNQLVKAAKAHGCSHVVGTTASASGFYGCQGRKVGQMKLAMPNLVDELGAITFNKGEQVVNIEMENSALCFFARAMSFKAGTICVIVARRSGPLREFAPPDVTKKAITSAIQCGLDAVTSL